MTDRAALFMRVQGQDEVCIGHVATMRDIPLLLEEVAALFRGAQAAALYRDQSDSGLPYRVTSDV